MWTVRDSLDDLSAVIERRPLDLVMADDAERSAVLVLRAIRRLALEEKKKRKPKRDFDPFPVLKLIDYCLTD